MTTRAEKLEKARAAQALLNIEGTTGEVQGLASAPIVPQDEVPTPQTQTLSERAATAEAEFQEPSIFDRASQFAGDAVDFLTPDKIDPNAARFAGGMIGGTLAAPSGPIGSRVGAALLAEGFGQGAELFNEFVLNNTSDQKPEDQRALDAATSLVVDMFLGGLGSKAEELAQGLGRRVLTSGANRTAQASTGQLARDFQQTGIQPTAGAFGSQLVQGIEQALSKLPTSAKIVQRHLNKTLDDIAGFSSKIVSDLTGKAKPLKPQVSGRRIQKAIGSFVENGKIKQNALYDKVADHVPSNFKMPMSNTSDLLNKNQDILSELKTSRSVVVPDLFKKVMTDISNNEGSLSWQATKNLRSSIGELIGDPRVNQSTTKDKLSALYASLTADMKAGADMAGPGAKAAWQRATDFTRGFAARKELIGDIKDSRLGREAFDAVLSGAKRGPELLNAVKKSVQGVDPKAWDDFVGTYLDEMSRALPGQQAGTEAAEFSLNTFLKNYNTMKKSGAADILFGGAKHEGLKESMDRLVRISNSIKDSAQFANPSGTASQTVFTNILQGNIGQATTQAGLQTGTAGAIVGSAGLLTPAIYGKLVTNKNFIDWLGKGLQIAPTNFNGIGTHMGRLAGIAKVNPEISEHIQELVKNVQSQELNKNQNALVR